MKLFSRKALVAGATALSVTFAGTAVATAAEEPTTLSSNKTGAAAQPYANDKGSNNVSDDAEKKPQTEKTSQEKAREVQAWIGVFTAAIGALGTLFAFADKYLDIEGFLKNFKLPF
ncbi:hypothetical protein [Corynebacterium accolens]|jgi:hypothetical protein|uniref:hypothetical protein n=1 Tax=Corynebacterium accolens TaxID=38284 RepID=UPI00254297B4|nr:hypothetical protein [Corynebacterium accolens]MDK4294260.1 hypothetical protein [Corynebacterium accolens]WKS62696.1 hypothetical protein NLL39_01025 [Corynebacterium accolens]